MRGVLPPIVTRSGKDVGGRIGTVAVDRGDETISHAPTGLQADDDASCTSTPSIAMQAVAQMTPAPAHCAPGRDSFETFMSIATSKTNRRGIGMGLGQSTFAGSASVAHDDQAQHTERGQHDTRRLRRDNSVGSHIETNEENEIVRRRISRSKRKRRRAIGEKRKGIIGIAQCQVIQFVVGPWPARIRGKGSWIGRTVTDTTNRDQPAVCSNPVILTAC